MEGSAIPGTMQVEDNTALVRIEMSKGDTGDNTGHAIDERRLLAKGASAGLFDEDNVGTHLGKQPAGVEAEPVRQLDDPHIRERTDLRERRHVTTSKTAARR